MKQLFLFIIAFSLLASGGLAADTRAATKGDVITLSGTIVDNLCAEAHKAGMDAFIKSHTRECALMPDCAASGYSLYHYGALLPFDRASSKKIETFLKKKREQPQCCREGQKERREIYPYLHKE